MNERLLITGTSGFVGSNVVEYLEDNSNLGLIKSNFDLTKETYHFPYEYIANFASISSVEQSVVKPLDVIENNVMSTTHLLEMARDYIPKLFIQFSTIESQDVTNPYAASKKAQEAICLAYQRTYDIPITVIHSTNIVGPNQGNDKFVPKIIEQIKADKPITIYTHKGEMAKRTYNPVRNVGSAILHLIQYHEDYQTFNEVGIAGGESLDNLELAQRVAKLLGKELAYRFVDVDNIRPNYLMNYEPENGIEGWQPVQTLDDALKELL